MGDVDDTGIYRRWGLGGWLLYFCSVDGNGESLWWVMGLVLVEKVLRKDLGCCLEST